MYELYNELHNANLLSWVLRRTVIEKVQNNVGLHIIKLFE